MLQQKISPSATKIPHDATAAGMETPSKGTKVSSFLTLRNELPKETHVLTEQEILLGRCAQPESSRVREPRRTALP